MPVLLMAVSQQFARVNTPSIRSLTCTVEPDETLCSRAPPSGGRTALNVRSVGPRWDMKLSRSLLTVSERPSTFGTVLFVLWKLAKVWEVAWCWRLHAGSFGSGIGARQPLDPGGRQSKQRRRDSRDGRCLAVRVILELYRSKTGTNLPCHQRR